jgi:excisionase family DNA binding protein
MHGQLGAADAALMLAVSREVLVRMIQCGRLKGSREGRFWAVDRADLERLLREREGSRVAQAAS